MVDFFPQTEKTFDLDDEHEFTVRKLTYGEMSAASGSAVARAEKSDGENATVLIYLRNEVAIRSVISWSGPAFDAIECNAQNISRLSLDIGSQIEQAAWRFNGGNEDDNEDSEKKESGDITND